MIVVRKGEDPPGIVAASVWERIEPLLPEVERRRRYPGRRRLDDRKVRCGILFVRPTGIRWEFLPREPGLGSGMTCWRRLAELPAAGKLDGSRAVIDSSHVRALQGGRKTGPSPLDRARPGSKHHVPTDGHGTPLAVSLTGGNRNDVTQLIPLLGKVPPVRDRVGRPSRRPDCQHADRGYDHDKDRRLIPARGVKHRIGRRGGEHGSGLGKHRYVVERTIALLHGCRRRRIRWEIRDDIPEAFLSLAAALICWRPLTR
jgi:transposase